MKTVNDYTDMQRNFYVKESTTMRKANHSGHNANPDYWNILLGLLNFGDWSDKRVLDFGCGCGRNVANILNGWNIGEVHGCDISETNIEYCNQYIPTVSNKTNYEFFVNDGQSLRPAQSNYYDMIVSTIVLQHICVYSIRRMILEDMYRCLKPGGILSIQMGFGYGHPNTARYYEDVVDATTTNSGYDVRIISLDEPINDLSSIGFINVGTNISASWEDSHQNWIYIKARKPA
jgi:SAM-dependent methyltransferase